MLVWYVNIATVDIEYFGFPLSPNWTYHSMSNAAVHVHSQKKFATCDFIISYDNHYIVKIYLYMCQSWLCLVFTYLFTCYQMIVLFIGNLRIPVLYIIYSKYIFSNKYYCLRYNIVDAELSSIIDTKCNKHSNKKIEMVNKWNKISWPDIRSLLFPFYTKNICDIWFFFFLILLSVILGCICFERSKCMLLKLYSFLIRQKHVPFWYLRSPFHSFIWSSHRSNVFLNSYGFRSYWLMQHHLERAFIFFLLISINFFYPVALPSGSNP